MYDLLFDPSLLYLVIGGVAALGLGVYAFRSGDRRMQKIALAATAVVALWVVVSSVVKTPKELSRAGTREVLRAVVDRQSEPLQRLFAPSMSLGRLGKDDVIFAAKVYADRFGLKSADVLGLETAEESPYVIVNVAVLAQFDSAGKISMGGAVKTNWAFRWGKTQDGWQLVSITPLAIGDMDTGAATGKYFERRPTP